MNEYVNKPSEQEYVSPPYPEQSQEFPQERQVGPLVGGLLGGLFGPPGPPPAPGAPTGPPTSPPPNFTPPRPPGAPGISPFAVDPGAIVGCMFRYTYVWLTNWQQFWFFPIFVGRTSVAGFRWTGFSWVYFGIDLQQIDSFQCV